MDKRQQKTRAAIFGALARLLEKQRYETITVQQIIDEANIGRSTFYAHFETKDALLYSMCTDIFEHVFEKHPPRQVGSEGTIEDLQWKLAHVLFHLREDNEKLKGILKSDSSEVFMGYLKEYLAVMFRKYLSLFPKDVPERFLLHHLVGSFSETVIWWIGEGTSYSPEDTAQFFINVLRLP